MEIDAAVTDELERRLVEMQPWMHPYRFGPETIVGYFKDVETERTACITGDDPALIDRMRRAYERRLSTAGWEVQMLAERLGDVSRMTALDIACATGLHSFELARAGFGHVRGVEIRPEQVEQARLVRDVDRSGDLAAVVFDHEPVSADAAFLAGERYDVVLSMGLLYHLVDPVEHIRNLRRLAGRAVMLRTFTHARDRSFWSFHREPAAWMTKATQGRGFQLHFADIPDLLLAEGFERVDVLAPPELADVQAWDLRDTRLERLLLPGAAFSLLERRRGRGYLRRFESALQRGFNPRYYTYLAT